jgi:hypothetical protein
MSDLAFFLGQALVVVASMGALIIGLSLFFKWLPRLGPKRPALNVHDAAVVFDEGRHYDVLLSSGHQLKALRFEGLVQSDSEAGWTLRQFAVMRRADGGKVILRLDNVRVFEEVATAPVEN